MLKGKKILLGVTASIAAYKAILLVRLFVKAGAEVKVVMTPAAKEFVSPLVLSTLSKNAVVTDMFNNEGWSNHVMMGRWADVFVMAPLSCNTLAKMAAGICDNMLMAVYLSCTCQVVCAPAMDEDMWKHPSTKANLAKVMSFGNKIIEVNHGELASGLVGEGRMAESEIIFAEIEKQLSNGNQLQGKRVVVTAGPTYENIDPVRFIGNYSSGKMGFALAEAFSQRGAAVTLISGPSACTTPVGVKRINVTSAGEMFDETTAAFAEADVCVMAAAVADYKPAEVADQKIKKTGKDLVELKLVRTQDILASLGKQKRKGQLLIGFALETENEEANAWQKLKDKNADLIILNSLNDEGAAFGGDTNKVTVFDKSGKVEAGNIASKALIAQEIIDIAIKYL